MAKPPVLHKSRRFGGRLCHCKTYAQSCNDQMTAAIMQSIFGTITVRKEWILQGCSEAQGLTVSFCFLFAFITVQSTGLYYNSIFRCLIKPRATETQKRIETPYRHRASWAACEHMPAMMIIDNGQ